MSMNAILMVTLYPLLFILYAMMRSEAKPRKNILLGVTLPFAARQDEEVQNIVRSYKKWLTLQLIVLALVPLCVLFPMSSGMSMFVMMTWMLFVIVVPYIPYTIAHRRLKRLKHTRGWAGETAGKVLVDTRALVQVDVRQVSEWWFVLSFAMGIAPVVALFFSNVNDKWGYAMLYGINILLIVLCRVLYKVMYRQKMDIVDDNTALSVALTQVRRHNWGKCFAGCAVLTALWNVALWVFGAGGNVIVISALIYPFALMCIVLYTEFTARRVQYTLTTNSGQQAYADEDEYWINGMFYYNPNDKHLMINNRTGIGASVNMGRRSGMVLMVASMLLLLLVPLVGVWMMHEENTPVAMEISGTELIALHTRARYRIPLDTIESVTVLSPIPSGARVAGTGMDTVQKGHFHFDGIGSANTCLDPRVNTALFVVAGGENYVLNSGSTADIQTVYAQLIAYNAAWKGGGADG
ncbi:hypothetical protein LJC07_08275 [Christensenellaceae bacterium OttesenSCG-928-L17]|nr:hypothetical protein [Christensenellaceae bacterium OttesenSCG-928-L17]